MSTTVDLEAQIKALQKKPSNKRCFDCWKKGTQTYVILSPYNIFVCQECAGIHREFNHKSKGINMCSFSVKEIEQLEAGGNKRAEKIWHATLDEETRSRMISSHQSGRRSSDTIKRFMTQTYRNQTYYRPLSEDSDKRRKSKKKKHHSKSRREEEKGRSTPISTLSTEAPTSPSLSATSPPSSPSLDATPRHTSSSHHHHHKTTPTKHHATKHHTKTTTTTHVTNSSDMLDDDLFSFGSPKAAVTITATEATATIASPLQKSQQEQQQQQHSLSPQMAPTVNADPVLQIESFLLKLRSMRGLTLPDLRRLVLQALDKIDPSSATMQPSFPSQFNRAATVSYYQQPSPYIMPGYGQQQQHAQPQQHNPFYGESPQMVGMVPPPGPGLPPPAYTQQPPHGMGSNVSSPLQQPLSMASNPFLDVSSPSNATNTQSAEKESAASTLFADLQWQ